MHKELFIVRLLSQTGLYSVARPAIVESLKWLFERPIVLTKSFYPDRLAGGIYVYDSDMHTYWCAIIIVMYVGSWNQQDVCRALSEWEHRSAVTNL